MYYKNPNGTFTVISRSNPNIKWIVSADMRSCNCPKFKWILKGQSPCHHMDEVIKGESQLQEFDGFETYNPKTFIKPMKHNDFAEKYGDDQLEHLIRHGEVCLDRGIVRRLI